MALKRILGSSLKVIEPEIYHNPSAAVRVYRALWRPDSGLSLPVVIKAVDPARAAREKLPRAARERMMHEGRMHARVAHRGVRECHGLYCETETGEPSGLVLEHCSGTLLGRKGRGTAPWGTALRQVAETMAHIHRRGVAHRDLKPANIFVQDHRGVSRALIGDLDQAAAFEPDRLTGPVGTLVYMAPEVLAEQPYGPACDVYSFGVLAYECVEQRAPYRGLLGCGLPGTISRKEFIDRVRSGKLRPSFPECTVIPEGNAALEEMRALVTQCWAQVSRIEASSIH